MPLCVHFPSPFGAPKPGKKRAKGDFRCVKLSNKTHRSKTDPDALLARKSNAHPAQPGYRGHVLMDNRHALIVDCQVTQAEMRRIGVTPHVDQNAARLGGSAIDGRTTRHEGYSKSINARRGIEKVFAWIKQLGGLRQFKLRGTKKVSAVFGLHLIAYNLIRLGNLLRPAAMKAA